MTEETCLPALQKRTSGKEQNADLRISQAISGQGTVLGKLWSVEQRPGSSMDEDHSTDHPCRLVWDDRKRILEVQYVEFYHHVVLCNARIGIALGVIFIPLN